MDAHHSTLHTMDPKLVLFEAQYIVHAVEGMVESGRPMPRSWYFPESVAHLVLSETFLGADAFRTYTGMSPDQRAAAKYIVSTVGPKVASVTGTPLFEEWDQGILSFNLDERAYLHYYQIAQLNKL